MNNNLSTAATDGNPIKGLSEEITRLSDMIRACERLCLLSARAVIRAAVPLVEQERPLSFIPVITRDLQSSGDNYDSWRDGLPKFLGALNATRNGSTAECRVGWNPTTSAGCIVALQALLPVMRRFRLGTRENKDLTFHPIERETLDEFNPRKTLPNQIATTINKGVAAFDKETLGKIYRDYTGAKLSEADLVDTCLFSTTFGGKHPYTAAQTLRALAGSSQLFGPVWRHSLFIVLWFLNRRGSSLRGQPNIQATTSPGTAVMTSKCVDAIDSVYAVFERRWNRFHLLIRLIGQLAHVQEVKDSLERNNDSSLRIFDKGYCYRETLIVDEIRNTLADIAKDTGIPGLYTDWNERLIERLKVSTSKADFLKSLIETFVEAIEKLSGNENADELLQLHEAIKKEVKAVHDRVKESKDLALPDPWPPLLLPPWLCSRNFWKATATAMRPPAGGSDAYADAINRTCVALETHWHRHFDALEMAFGTTREVENYYHEIMKSFKTVRRGMPVKDFIAALTDAGKPIAGLHRELRKGIDAGVKWAEVLMNRHLGYAAAGLVTLFDPNELAHAVRVVCRPGGRVRFQTILAAIRAVCAAQRQDGTWSCQQPFYWTEAGHGLLTLSVETALAVVSSVNEIVRNPEGFGASREEVSSGLQPVYSALDRFFGWLSGSIQSVPLPLALIDPKLTDLREPPLNGWSSDRIFEPSTIHSWVTANAIEFLISYRQLLQEIINQRLRSEFLSHHPAELLPPLSEITPTDLAKYDGHDETQSVVTVRLLEALQPHKALELAEGPWLPREPDRPPITFYSALFYGPPGSSKTFMAKAVAGELRWPLISLSPADFLARGEQNVEAQSEAIFTALSGGSRLVYFFDEIDELVRDRNQTIGHERSIFTFLTPSLLTKLQELHDSAKQQEFIFILGTNYLDHIDSAAIRSGRIDEHLPIVYSDRESRAYMMIDRLIENLKIRLDGIEKVLGQPAIGKYRDEQAPSIISVSAEFAGFLSYSNLQQIVDEIEKLFIDPNNTERIEQFIKDLRELNERAPRARFKPEVRLADYCDRAGSLEEIKMVVQCIPDRTFPWSCSQKLSLRLEELTKLHEKIPDTLKDFKRGVEELKVRTA
jgi:hypothetical protein